MQVCQVENSQLNAVRLVPIKVKIVKLQTCSNYHSRLSAKSIEIVMLYILGFSINHDSITCHKRRNSCFSTQHITGVAYIYPT